VIRVPRMPRNDRSIPPRGRQGWSLQLFTPSHCGGSGPPLVCLHGFTDTWRTWELVLPALERRHDVLAPTLAGHAGGPPIRGDVTDALLADAVERALDDAGIDTAHFAGNSLGGYRDEWLPHADWVVLDGAGHCPQLDVPLETAELILGFTDQGS
jgi:pimeloyl-ACP methyl ester carboxylesterase